jgi:hypothetical protein
MNKPTSSAGSSTGAVCEPSPLYVRDFDEWVKEQVRLLRERKFSDLMEEVEDLAASNRRELKNRTVVLTAHLLKWDYQPEERSHGWVGSIEEQRDGLTELFADVPSLRNSAEGIMPGIYDRAVKLAMADTGLKRDIFPPGCPYNFENLFSATVEMPAE